MKKKILSLLLAVVMLTSILPMSAITAQARTYTSGQVAADALLSKGDRLLPGSIVQFQAYPLYEYSNRKYTYLAGPISGDFYYYTIQKCYLVDSRHSGDNGWVVVPSHDYSIVHEEITPATCINKGQFIYECSACGTLSSVTNGTTYGPHDLDEGVYTPPTCTEKGYTTQRCKLASWESPIITIDDETPLAEHNYDVIKKVKSTKEAPYSGYEIIGCTMCGEFKYGRALDKDGNSCVFDSYDWVEIPNEGDTVYPESQHPYANNLNSNPDIQNITYPGAAKYRFTFSSSSETENSFDYLYLLDSKGNEVQKLCGSSFAGKTYEVDSDSVDVKLTSDYSTAKWGYSFSKIEAATPILKPTSEDYSYLAYKEYNFVVDGEELDTIDDADEASEFAFKSPIQRTNNIFLGWTDDNGDYVDSTASLPSGDIASSFRTIGPMAKDPLDEKKVASYMEFGLVGVQIREDNTQEVNEKNNIYGGLRFVASFGEDLYDSLNIIEYGFVVATKDNATINADGNANYKIKNGDKNVKRINCKTGKDHRTFNDYRLFTFVIDYEGNEGLKDVEMVVRPYIAYRDNNGVARIFYGSYDGTNTYGGLSTSYNNCVAL